MPNQQGTKRRGRPSKYATKEEKTLAAVQGKRAKRQHQASEQRAQQYDQFYGVNLPSMLYSLPPLLSHGKIPADPSLRAEDTLLQTMDMPLHTSPDD